MLYTSAPTSDSPRVTRAIRIRQPVIALYTAWFHLSQRPTTASGAASATWSARSTPAIKVPCGHSVGPTFIEDHIHGVFISWKSSGLSGIVQSGEVWFHSDDGVESTVSVLLSWAADNSVDSTQRRSYQAEIEQLDQDLHHFKFLMER